jgi:hypothetical protein
MVYTAGVMEGAMIGAVIGMMAYPVLVLVAKQKQKTGQAMGKPTIREVFWPGSQQEALQRGQFVLGELKANIINVDHANGVILAGTGWNFRSYGSTVHVFVRPAQGGFQVVVQTAPTMSLYDTGFSRSFTNDFVAKWQALGPPRAVGGPGQFVV